MNHLKIIFLAFAFLSIGCSEDSVHTDELGSLNQNWKAESIVGQVETTVHNDKGEFVEHLAPKYGVIFKSEEAEAGEGYYAFLSVNPISCDHRPFSYSGLWTPLGQERESVDDLWHFNMLLQETGEWSSLIGVLMDTESDANLHISTLFRFTEVVDEAPEPGYVQFVVDYSEDSYANAVAHMVGDFALKKCF